MLPILKEWALLDAGVKYDEEIITNQRKINGALDVYHKNNNTHKSQQRGLMSTHLITLMKSIKQILIQDYTNVY